MKSHPHASSAHGPKPVQPYRGRLAPSPTGHLHWGHARTFWIAQQRARERGGTLVLRNEDLDTARCKPHFVADMLEDLRWFGFDWQEGPDCGGPRGPYNQSERREFYLAAMRTLLERGCIYPCTCSRQDVLRALQAPHQGEEEPVYPGTCRSQSRSSRREEAPFPICNPQSATCNQSAPPHVGCYGLEKGSQALSFESDWRTPNSELGTRNSNLRPNWRFRVPDGEIVSFADSHFGPQHFIAGQDFGDFVVWRHDGVPAYQLAVVVDDAAMGITEVVRGADLLPSTARQILLYRALGLEAPAFFYCPLMTDAAGARLAKRHDALSLRTLREQGRTPERLREMMG